MNDYDVIVVGARVAGASTALLLARAGARVALVDRSPYASDVLSTHGLMRAGVLQLSRWGLLDRVVAAGTPPIRATCFHYGDEEPVRVSIRPSFGVEALYAPRRQVLDRILVDAALEAGVEVLHETTVTRLLQDERGRTTGVRAVGRRGQTRELRARITVGADGIRSVVADQAGATVLHKGRTASAVLYRYVTGLAVEGYEWAYGSGAAAGLIPTNNGDTCVFVSTTPERMQSLRRDGVEEAFGSLLGQAAPLLSDRILAAEPVSRLHGWKGLPAHVLRSWGPGWALVGDAGYFKDPITTHGMTDAMRDAELLADELLGILSGEVPEPVALARYQATRDRLSGRLMKATEAVAAYDWDVSDVQRLLRQVSSAMSDEVEHLQSLSDRGERPAVASEIPADKASDAALT